MDSKAMTSTAPGPVSGSVAGGVAAASVAVGTLGGVCVDTSVVVVTTGGVSTTGGGSGGVLVFGGGGVALGTAVAITGLPHAPSMANLNWPFSMITNAVSDAGRNDTLGARL